MSIREDLHSSNYYCFMTIFEKLLLNFSLYSANARMRAYIDMFLRWMDVYDDGGGGGSGRHDISAAI